MAIINPSYQKNVYDFIENKSKFSLSHYYSYVVLHVMGHNAGLADPKNRNINSPMASGSYLVDFINGRGTYKTLVFGGDKNASVFRYFIRNYFNSNRWNGNPSNSNRLKQTIINNTFFDLYLKF